MAEVKVRANVGIMGFEPGDEFSAEDSVDIQGLINIGYLSELVPIVPVVKPTKVKLDEPHGGDGK